MRDSRTRPRRPRFIPQHKSSIHTGRGVSGAGSLAHPSELSARVAGLVSLPAGNLAAGNSWDRNPFLHALCVALTTLALGLTVTQSEEERRGDVYSFIQCIL